MKSSKKNKVISPLDWLFTTVSECLGLPPDELEAGAPLTRYGMDSLAAVELTAAISSKLRCEVPESLLLEYPDIESLEGYISAIQNGTSPGPAGGVARIWPIERILADCVLPSDIQLSTAGPDKAVKSILLTGGTGFLGAYILRALLRETRAVIYCLVRPDEAVDGKTRIRRSLESRGIWDPSFESRVRPLLGDISLPYLGLERKWFETLSGRIDAVYHTAAVVDWVISYSDLRDTNVFGTVELLRFAFRNKAKAFHFVSTAAVCYSINGPSEVAEDDASLPPLNGIHLGYAQSKWVSEMLVRRAWERGLPVTIHRPSLISGDSQSGYSNLDDFLSKLIKGCIQMGCAPDLNWEVDCCPVDYVADAIVRLTRTECSPLHVFHLTNPKPRHWREYILWINLYGYPVRMIPYESWLKILEVETRTPEHALHPLRPFFLSRPDGAGGLTFPEIYEEQRRSRLRSKHTRNVLSVLSLPCPPLNAGLLDRYFSSFIGRGFLPPISSDWADPGGAVPENFDGRFFTPILRRFHKDDSIRVSSVSSLGEISEHSIISELTSWRYGRSIGLSRFSIVTASRNGTPPEVLELIVKVKPKDEEVIGVGESVGALCGDEVGRAFTRFKNRTGLAKCHLRELAVYQQSDDRFRRHVPTVYGVIRDDRRHAWILVLENLKDMVLMDTAEEVGGWNRDHVRAVVRGVAEVHAIWYGREEELLAQPWLGPTFSASTMVEMQELWTALAVHAGRFFTDWVGSSFRTVQMELIAEVSQWWRQLETMPRTLIHNDFNPRNIALRDTKGGLRLCAYDWELATLGVPQHDLAEFLCFVLTPEASREEVLHYIELHRLSIQQATGKPIDPSLWQMGFRLSLYDLILNRFPMYALIHTFRRQKFLQRVIETWRVLYEYFPFVPSPAPRVS